MTPEHYKTNCLEHHDFWLNHVLHGSLENHATALAMFIRSLKELVKIEEYEAKEANKESFLRLHNGSFITPVERLRQ